LETIKFSYVIPQVFAQRVNELDSDIWNTDATFEKGHLYLVEADSGKGKSTFCSYVVGYRHDYSGSVTFDNDNTKEYDVKEWVDMRQHHISHLFQELRLFPELTAFENVEIKNKLTGFKSRDQIVKWFDMLGIGEKLDAKIGRMSFGQQQRVALIRSLVQPFDFIFADEPISHLDDTNSAIMAEIMMTEAKAQGAGVIVTSIGKHMDLDYEKTFKL
jgi:ABC-type lipoprotein export system ATPase subunit